MTKKGSTFFQGWEVADIFCLSFFNCEKLLTCLRCLSGPRFVLMIRPELKLGLYFRLIKSLGIMVTIYNLSA